MAGRTNWYSDHPPACTCAQCREGRAPRRRGRRSRRPGPQQPNKAAPVLFFALIILLVLVGLAAAYQQGYLDVLNVG